MVRASRKNSHQLTDLVRAVTQALVDELATEITARLKAASAQLSAIPAKQADSAREWLTNEQMAQRYGISRATLWRWVRDGKIPRPLTLSTRSPRFSRRDVEAAEREFSSVSDERRALRRRLAKARRT